MMLRLRMLRRLLLVALGCQIHAQKSNEGCDGNSQIRSSKDAETLASRCSEYNGNIYLDRTYWNTTDDNIVFDGLETLKGSIIDEACNNDRSECPEPPSFKVTVLFPDLEQVTGHIRVISGYDAISELRFPKLKVVNRTITSSALVTDLSALEYFGAWESPPSSIGRLHLGSLKGFAQTPVEEFSDSYLPNWVTIRQGRDVEGLLGQDMEIASDDNLPILNLDYGLNSIKADDEIDVNITWSKIGRVNAPLEHHRRYHKYNIRFGEPSLGNSSVERIFVESLNVALGKEGITRSPELNSLEVGQLVLNQTDDDELRDHLVKIDVNELETLQIHRTGAMHIELPDYASNWVNFSLLLDEDCCRRLKLTAYDREDDDRQIWYWPEEPMRDFIVGIGDSGVEWDESFWNTFSDNDTEVSHEFTLRALTGNVDCDAVTNNRGDRFPKDALCFASMASLHAPVSWTIQLSSVLIETLAAIL